VAVDGAHWSGHGDRNCGRSKSSDALLCNAAKEKAVEETCRKNGLERVTVEELERIRARMPTPKFFGSQGQSSAD